MIWVLLVLVVCLVVALAWPTPKDGFTHAGKLAGIPVYFAMEGDDGVVCAGQTMGYELLIRSGVPEASQFLATLLFDDVPPFWCFYDVKEIRRDA